MENKRDGVTVSKWRGVCSKISFGAGLAAVLFFLLFGVSWLLLDKDTHLIGRLDEWMLHLGFLSVVMTLIFKPGNGDGRWWRRTLFIVGKMVAILLILFCWILVFMCTSVGDRWSDMHYAVYPEPALRGSRYVLYEKKGWVEKKRFDLCYLELDGPNIIKRKVFTVNEDQDWIRAQFYYFGESGGGDYCEYYLYRLSTGEQLNVNEWLELRENGKD